MNENTETPGVDAQDRVIFDSETHTYTYNGKVLKGVTGMLARQGIAPAYRDFSPKDFHGVLMKAAQYGTNIHKAVEDFLGPELHMEAARDVNDMLGKVDEAMQSMPNVILTEYLVSDKQTVATQIDMVLCDNSLVEIKTSPILNELAVRWQLSIEAFLYEAQEKVPVPFIYCLHISGDTARVVEMDRIPDDEVKRFLLADNNGLKYVRTEYKPVADIATDLDVYTYIHNSLNLRDMADVAADLRCRIASFQRRLSEIEKSMKQTEDENKAISDKVLSYALEHNLDTIQTIYGIFTVTGAEALIKTDVRKMLMAHPDLAAEAKNSPLDFAMNYPEIIDQFSQRVLKLGTLAFKPNERYGESI